MYLPMLKPYFLLTIIVLLSTSLLSSMVWSNELVFKNHGKVVKTLSLEQIEKLIPSKTIMVFEPHELENRVYVGFPVNAFFTEVYGENWKEAEEILFTCSDGYQSSIPSARFKEYPAYLVYGRADKKEFTLINKLQNNEFVKLGPFYLIWDNLRYPELKAEDGEGWPYQVTTIDLINFSDRFPNMSPPKGSSEAVKNGFLAFRNHCMTCHTINGEGGGKSVELNYPASVTEYFKEPWLVRWIDKPTSVRYNTTMPALNPDLKDRETTIGNIIAYLKAMKNNKRKPLSEKH
jgi:mono/diheme cytochrome c family protein